MGLGPPPAPRARPPDPARRALAGALLGGLLGAMAGAALALAGLFLLADLRLAPLVLGALGALAGWRLSRPA